MNSLNLTKRDTSVSNNAKKLRRKGIVPGILYGRKNKEFIFEVGELELCREISKNGEHGIVNFDLNGEELQAVIKGVQRDSVTHKIIHLDLEELEKNKKIVSNVPIYYDGEEYLNKKGMVLQKEKDSVKIECNAYNLPKNIKININENNGMVFRVGDLEVASELSIIDDLNTVIASISYERKTVSDDMEAAE